MKSLEEKVEKLSELILESNNIVALTGAGMSTESGIADFRSPGTGLWEKIDPYEFASIHSYVANTSKNLEFMLETGRNIFRARPNKGHKALTKLQKLGKLKGVLTQNIDRLHHKAKTKNIVEFHGNAYEAKCMSCGQVYEITFMVNQVMKGNYSPSCEKCKGILKPNAIFFGEPLESATLEAADAMIAECDLLLVLGSSLVVYPVAFYPQKILSLGAKLAIINIQETDMDSAAEVVIHEKIGDILPKVVSIVEEKKKIN
ncbi:MAG: NAD-dependent protein deacylase [Candidatus Lokiarchaeota archaeon]|nr:NAD-dependent protein deacylase [Candidatus Lokiarchaeota archaeon]